jgi:hypothetical protein
MDKLAQNAARIIISLLRKKAEQTQTISASGRCQNFQALKIRFLPELDFTEISISPRF